MTPFLYKTRLLHLSSALLLIVNSAAVRGQEAAEPVLDATSTQKAIDSTKTPPLDELFAHWKEYCATKGGIYSNQSMLFNIESFVQMRRHGAKAVAYFIAKVEKNEDFGPIFIGNIGINSVMNAISQTGFHHMRVPTPEDPKIIVYRIEEFPGMEVGRRVEQTKAVWLKWWAEKDRKIPIWFRGRYQMWQAAKKTGDAKQTDAAFYKLKALGIFALPQWMEKLNSDPRETKAIIAAISDLTASEVAPNASKAQVVAWWKASRLKWTGTKPNAPTAKKPTAKAK